MSNFKKIAKIRVIKAGSPPDIDSDFNTLVRDKTLKHCEELYGHNNIANITTFNTLAAKAAFKTMCTIYEIPFVQANKIASLVPPPIEGVECTLDDIFNPDSPRYAEGKDFRQAVAGDKWVPLIEGARNIEGKNKSIGVHPCGIIMSSKPLDDVIPLQVRQDDGRVITQWTYQECESMGLIKFDFLGLDTVDLIQHTVEYILKSGKPAPNMIEIAHGEMNDKKTFEMLAKGNTIGIFQLSGQGVQDLLRRMKPTEFDDIVATTALYRPGPMGMNSHTKYADRKSGREKPEYIHKDFEKTPLENILKPTKGILIFQEQVAQIANQIGGLTLQEGDKLRKAMGKKITEVMLEMKPKFIEGAVKKGYSKEAVEALWDTMEPFSKYAFNKSHSVGYAMIAYQAAYLKAHYPVEFMAALIAQHVEDKDKTLSYLQECRKMGLVVKTADINLSDVKVAPNFNGSSKEIVYGLSGVKAVSQDMARIIVNERTKNGIYKDVQDLLNRCIPLGVANKRIYENLALAGAFDSMCSSRRGLIESFPDFISEAKTKKNKGASLFDALGDTSMNPTQIDPDSIEEYSHLEKLKKEADVIGLYLTSHPLSNIETLSGLRNASIKKLVEKNERSIVKVVGGITSIETKRMRRGGKVITITLDDGTGYISARLSKELVKGLDKKEAQEKLKRMYLGGADNIPKEIVDTALDKKFDAVTELEVGSVYSVELAFRPGFDENPYSAQIRNIVKVDLTKDGRLPVRVRLRKPKSKQEKSTQIKFIQGLSKDFPGDSSLMIGYLDDRRHLEDDSLFRDASNDLGNKDRSWPPPKSSSNKGENQDLLKPTEVNYRSTKYTVDKNPKLAQRIEETIGIENYDFGIFDSGILDD